MIIYAPENFFIAHWFADQPSAEYRRRTGVANMNWIAAVWRKRNGLYIATHRFAYFNDREQVIRSNWHEAELIANTPIERGIAILDDIAQQTSVQNGGSMWERVDLNLPGDKAIKVLLKKSWMRVVATSADMN